MKSVALLHPLVNIKVRGNIRDDKLICKKREKKQLNLPREKYL